MKKQFACVMTACCMLTASIQSVAATVSTPTEQQIIQSIGETEAAYLNAVLQELEIDSLDSIIQRLTRDDDPPVPASRIKNLDGISTPYPIGASDAQFILNFLNGQVVYNGDFNDMDVTADYIIDKADAVAYLDYYLYLILNELPMEGNYSAPGPGSAPESASESITYVKHLASSGVSPSSTNDIVYTITAPVANNNFIQPEALNNNDPQRSSYTPVYNPRVVRNSGTGSIIGEHLIITDAHCIYDRNTSLYNTETQKIYYDFDENNNPVFFEATVISYHVPQQYIINGTHRYDYALVVVQENLITDYQCESFDIGLALDNAAPGTSVSIEGFPGVPEVMAGGDGIHRYRPVISHGSLTSMTQYMMISSAASTHGSSGALVYTQTSYDDNEYDTAIGNVSYTDRSGTRFTRPILQFCFNNPYLT